MNTGRRLLITLLCAVFIFGWFSWPLYRHFNRGITYTSAVSDAPPVRYMVMGDHLQLLYHFWLTSDWLRGQTPLGYNPYLFNTGDDEDTACPSTDYLPFSGLFAILHLVFTRATAWNLTNLAVIWMSLFFLTRLLQVYGADERQSILLAIIYLGLPYQWATLFGGSPTGFAMMSVPMMLYGMERIIRTGAFSGTVLAIAGLLAAFWTDAHVILFLILLAPAWGLLILVHEPECPWQRWSDWLRRLGAGAPLAITALVAVVLRMRSKAGLGESTMSEGRGLSEVALFSPHRAGLVTGSATGHEHTIYIGPLLLLLIGTGIAIGLYWAWKQRNRREAAHIVLLAGGFLLIVAFALGTNGPFNAIVLHLARRLLPPIGMIRQPAKIFAILCPIAAVLSVPAMRALCGKHHAPAWRILPALLVAGLLLLNLSAQIRPGICLLDETQQAYAAIVEDTPENTPPRAIAIPIWPGDSAWSSLYQHYTSLYRIRLVNGYLPFVAQDYVESVYLPLDSLNSGLLSPGQIKLLADMGVRHLILHEDAYPEQVSWFPVGAALKKLLEHPQLRLLAQDGPVWAFRILDAPQDRSNSILPLDDWTPIGSRIQSEMEHERLLGNAQILGADSASGGLFVRLATPGDGVSMGNFNHQEAHDANLMIRVRGKADWAFQVHNEDSLDIEEVETRSEAWTWITMPIRWRKGTALIRPALTLTKGHLDVDRVSYISGQPPTPAIGESVLIPATVLFRAGYTDIESGAVVFRTEREPARRILYGPRWPLPDGRYLAEPVWAEPPPDERLGRFELKMGHETIGSVAWVGPDNPPLAFSTQPLNLPLEFGFYYERKTDLRIRGIRITRVE